MQKTSDCAQKLFYHGTNIDVRLGDRVVWKRRFRTSIQGTVVYIPGISPHHPDLEREGVRQWAVELDNGGVLLMVYWPGSKKGQPRSNIKFSSRGDPRSLPPDKRLN